MDYYQPPKVEHVQYITEDRVMTEKSEDIILNSG